MGTLVSRYCTSLIFALTSVTAAFGQAAAPDESASPEIFKVFVAGHEIGSEEVTISDTAGGGTTISSTGVIRPPLDILLDKAEAVYGASGEPERFSIEASVKGQPVRLETTFSGGEAASTLTQGGAASDKTEQVSSQTAAIGQGALFLGAYHGLARRLASTAPGASTTMYVVPLAEVDVRVDEVEAERLQTARGTFDTRRVSATIQDAEAPVPLSVWIDASGRLLRLTFPAQGLDVVREDVAAVSARQVRVWRENDEDVRVPASGFALAATVSKPLPPEPEESEGSNQGRRSRPSRIPAVVLVGGAGTHDRDATVAGIPMLGQLANQLSDAGYLTIRYDDRGSGLSGGRTESATLDDYAEDVRAAVRYLRSRRDVDRDRIVVVGHREGAAVALLAAARERHIDALVLLAGPGTTGSDLLLERQRHSLSRTELSQQERERRMAQQLTIQHAVLTGIDWDEVPEELQKQADTPWFRSWLAYDPAETMDRVRQPILILHGDLDTEVAPHHAEKLLALAEARRRGRGAAMTTFPDLNHLFVRARTGEVDEYPVLPDRAISPAIGNAIATWLAETLQR